MSEEPYRYCVCDIHQRGTSGFIVIEEPTTVIAAVSVPETTLENLAETMRLLHREHGIRSFWVEAGDAGLVCDYLRRVHRLPIRRVGP